MGKRKADRPLGPVVLLAKDLTTLGLKLSGLSA
jgi:hypothetical protein